MVSPIKASVVCLMLLTTSSVTAAAPNLAKSGTLKRKGCQTLADVRLCFTPSDMRDSVSLFVAGKSTRLMSHGWDNFLPYEMDVRNGVYRVKVGTPSRSDVDFFAYTEVRLRKSGSRFLVDHYAIATDSECEGSPDIRMRYDFDLRRRTMTSVLEPPWSNDRKVHRFVRGVPWRSADPFRLTEEQFINFLGERPEPALQRLCSA